LPLIHVKARPVAVWPDAPGETEAVMKLFAGGIGSWFDRRGRAMGELKALDHAGPVDIERMAAGVGMSVDELADLIARGSETTELVGRMMAAHGLSRAKLSKAAPGLVETIESRCEGCRHRHRCEIELNAGTAADHATAFCPNARTMQALAQDA
jgi:hypothetical protein